jgi:hypothetical protein
MSYSGTYIYHIYFILLTLINAFVGMSSLNIMKINETFSDNVSTTKVERLAQIVYSYVNKLL